MLSICFIFHIGDEQRQMKTPVLIKYNGINFTFAKDDKNYEIIGLIPAYDSFYTMADFWTQMCDKLNESLWKEEKHYIHPNYDKIKR